MISFAKINNGNTEMAQKTLLITNKCAVLTTSVRNHIFLAKAGFVFNLFLCSEKNEPSVRSNLFS